MALNADIAGIGLIRENHQSCSLPARRCRALFEKGTSYRCLRNRRISGLSLGPPA